MKEFKDAHGVVIKDGDLLRRRFVARWRERPGNRRVATDGWGRDNIVYDEGALLEGTNEWVTFKVRWSGACMIIERYAWSDFQALQGAVHFDAAGNRVHGLSTAMHYMDEIFESELYEIMKEHCGGGR